MSAALRYRPIEERELAKDFGFDVTAPSGGVQTSGANNREYKIECRKIYSEFLMNMRDYIFQEEQIKKELTKLRTQAASPHKPTRDPLKSSSPRCSTTRRDSVYSKLSDTCLQDEGVLRPGRINLSKKRPKTVIGTVREVNLDQVDSREDSILPDIITTHGGSTSTSNSTVKPSSTVADNRKQSLLRDRENHNAIVESNSDFACSRIIRMNPRAYSKLVCGKANVHVLNRTSGYLLKPVSETKTDILMPKNVGRSNCPERLAIVRERTNFKSPTLSNDLKVNNLLAIKKSLVGDTSPRLTVGDAMNGARERRSRLYRIQLTSDVIENSKGQDQRSPRVSSYKTKIPCSSPPTARLTRKNLARFEQDIQKEAAEKLRKTVVEMVSRVENRGDDEQHSGEKHNNLSPRIYAEHLEDRISEDTFLCSQRTPRSHENDAIGDSFDHKLKFDNSLRRMSRVSYLETVTKIDSRQGSTYLERIKDGSRSRVRSEMSTRPSTMHSGFCSENSSPRRVNHQETIALVKQSKTEDDYRDNELNLWKQRMIFAVGKKDPLVAKK